jgi:hypothetical protein
VNWSYLLTPRLRSTAARFWTWFTPLRRRVRVRCPTGIKAWVEEQPKPKRAVQRKKLVGPVRRIDPLPLAWLTMRAVAGSGGEAP